MSLMSKDDHARVTAAIRKAEAHTSGEIHCVLAGASDGYFLAAASVLSAAVLLVSFPVALWFALRWSPLDALVLSAAQILALAASLLLIRLFPRLRLMVTPRRVRYRTAHANAMRQFLARNVHVTEHRTGVLVFVSLAERYAAIIADSGINAHVPQDIWNAIVGHLTNKAAKNHLADGFEEAIAAIGGLLAAKFPPRTDDRNELSDHLVEL